MAAEPIVFADEGTSVPLHVEEDQPSSVQDDASSQRTRQAKIGFGLAMMTLVGGSAWALLQLSAPAAVIAGSADHPSHVPKLAFSPTLQAFRPGGVGAPRPDAPHSRRPGALSAFRTRLPITASIRSAPSDDILIEEQRAKPQLNSKRHEGVVDSSDQVAYGQVDYDEDMDHSIHGVSVLYGADAVLQQSKDSALLDPKKDVEKQPETRELLSPAMSYGMKFALVPALLFLVFGAAQRSEADSAPTTRTRKLWPGIDKSSPRSVSGTGAKGAGVAESVVTGITKPFRNGSALVPAVFVVEPVTSAPSSMSASPLEGELAVSPSFAAGAAQRPEQPELPPATSTVAGAAALVAGTTVGAGILALPAKTLAAGFLPSSGALVLAWIYMASTGILIAEVNVNTVCGLGRNSVSMSSMASDTLGDGAARLSGVAYVFIHYCLLVAYTVSGGAIVAEVLQLPTVAGSVGFTAVLGSALLAGTYQQVERVNSALVAGVVGTFGALLWSGIPNIQPELLAHAEPAAVLPAVPVLVLSLVYHNIVPTITFQLGCDLPKIRKAIVLGSFVPLVMFLALDAVVLGATPFDAAAGMAPGEIFDPLLALRSSGGAFAETVRSFTLLAIVTSCIGFTYGLSDYWADLLGWEAPDALDSEDGAEAAERPLPEKAALYGLTLVPPLAIACSDPSLFFTALDNAGAFGVLTLFGILPAAMAWEQRYGLDANPAVEPALPGGRAVLAFMGTAALGVVGIQAWERLAAALQLS